MENNLPKIETLEEIATYGKFVVEPLDRGFGATLGNALRRVMLSSIEGAAITSVKIGKVLHEFSTIPGIKEDTTELLLNLKEMFIKVEGSAERRGEQKILKISRKGAGRVTGADVECPEGVQVVNPEVYLATISDDNASLEVEMTVEIGKGYVLPDKQERKSQMPIGVIPVGSAFTPVRRVNYTVEATRVGYKTDYERLVLEVITNGTISPSQAISQGAHILDQYFQQFMQFTGMAAPLDRAERALPEGSATQAPDARIEELDFSVRTFNCLKKASILTISELVQTTEAELMQIRNFGKKSLIEVREKLAGWNLTLKGGPTVNTGEVEGDAGPPEPLADELEPPGVGDVGSGSVSEEPRISLTSGIEALGLSQRTSKYLQGAGIRTIGELVQKSPEELMQVRNIGAETLADLYKKLAAKGLALKEGATKDTSARASADTAPEDAAGSAGPAAGEPWATAGEE